MDFGEYVVARRGRLIDHAVSLGCDDDDAPALVDEVMAARRRRIERSADPDPELYDAVERAVLGQDGARPRRWRLALGAAAGALLLAGAAVLLVPEPPTTSALPSYFGYAAVDAQEALEHAGFATRLVPARACEPQGLTLSTLPPAGSRVTRGTVVTVRSAVASGDNCLAVYGARSDAWAFVQWVRGGKSPDFAPTVNVVIDGREPRSVYLGGGAGRDAFGPVIDRLATAFATPAPERGMPRLVVLTGVPPEQQCGIARPAQSGERRALRLQVETSPDDISPCPLTVDLLRSTTGIDAVVVYSAQ